MFDRKVDYPTAVASHDDQGLQEAIDWCCQLRQDGDTVWVWTSLKRNLANSRKLSAFVSRYGYVQHITGRGGSYLSSPGPVLMAWPNMEALGQMADNGHFIRGLCVIDWYGDAIRPWVTAVRPAILGDGSEWAEQTPELEPVVVEAMKSITAVINHNNTIAAGFEKDQVVGALLALRDAGIALDGEAMQGWALAHGWSSKNPALLARYVRDINAGKRPQTRSPHTQEWVKLLQDRIED